MSPATITMASLGALLGSYAMHEVSVTGASGGPASVGWSKSRMSEQPPCASARGTRVHPYVFFGLAPVTMNRP
jgi:hypothetical protein